MITIIVIIVAILVLLPIALTIVLVNMHNRLNNLERQYSPLRDTFNAEASEQSGAAPMEERDQQTETLDSGFAEASEDYIIDAQETSNGRQQKIVTFARKGDNEKITVAASSNEEMFTDNYQDETQEATINSKPWDNINKIKELSFEDLVGGKLPIWIGGIALIFAGFFMVRYSIENGLIGPTARSIMATIFGFILVGLSNFGEKLPKIGHIFEDDDRIRQSLAGAGIAILYATLYMASELYGLFDITTSFILMVAVTILAFAMSLKHGPPTAVMGIIGGFIAPWIANMGGDNMPILLLYLAVFIAGVFGLSIWRGWLWLLMLTTGGGAVWTFALLESATASIPLLGLFITLLGAAAVFSAMRVNHKSNDITDDDSNNLQKYFKLASIYAPLALAMLQISILIPLSEFSPITWVFISTLTILSLLLAWRDQKLIPMAGLAACFAIVPIWAGWNNENFSINILVATLCYSILFAGAGHAWLKLKGNNMNWVMIAIFPPFAAYWISNVSYINHSWDPISKLSPNAWALWAAIVAVSTGVITWMYRVEDNKEYPVTLISVSATAIMATYAVGLLIPDDLIPSLFAITAMAVSAWAFYISSKHVRWLSYIAFILSIFGIFVVSLDIIDPISRTLSGQHSIYSSLPHISEVAVNSLLPSLIIFAMIFIPKIGLSEKGKIMASAVGLAAITIFLWLLSKHIFAISTASDFIQYGFAENFITTMAIALMSLASLWWARHKKLAILQKTAIILLGLVILRILIFDILLFNPLVRMQLIGPAPVANLGVVYFAALSIIFWLSSKWLNHNDSEMWKAMDNINIKKIATIISLLLGILTALILVRQLIHGSNIANVTVTTSENYLYSVILILLSVAWLARGILTGTTLLRLAGLGLLTITTLKVFLIDAAALEGILRILSFLGLGIALIGIGWAYGRLMSHKKKSDKEELAQDIAE